LKYYELTVCLEVALVFGHGCRNGAQVYLSLIRARYDPRVPGFPISRGPEQTVMRYPSHDWRSRLPQLSVVLCCLLLTAYFAHHALYGRYGLKVRSELLERSALLDFEIISLEAVRSKLEHDVALLAPDRPDPDIVEDIARDILGFAHPNDRIMLQSNNK
jgi:cell division protein FtsB